MEWAIPQPTDSSSGANSRDGIGGWNVERTEMLDPAVPEQQDEAQGDREQGNGGTEAGGGQDQPHRRQSPRRQVQKCG